jgi:hypothetical protein
MGKRGEVRWYHVLRDAAFAGTAIFMFVYETVFARPPNPYAYGAAIALTSPAVIPAIKAVLTSPGGGLSSPPGLSSAEGRSAESSGASGE